MRVSNQTGQILLGIGVAALAALFYVVRDLLRHWRVWHLPAVAICIAVMVLLARYLVRPR
ncbi:hypothetical protein [Terriglobus roseus]|uniref:Uncharacterized protein n=1 Tax=Terriglobus roseus TaxID=392734 RepID=A0A1H4LRT2_9BACT|nr:hypothetical protein [Terriglobus roseus]SEB73391.1 hypothetical protein SAMN05443244_1693 [Terriglobus roseus]